MFDATSRRSFGPTKFRLDSMAQKFRLKCPKRVFEATKQGFNSVKSLVYIGKKNAAQRGDVIGPESHSWAVVKIGGTS